MNELRIVRGSDVKLYAEDTPVFGVTAFCAKEKINAHKAYEYLSSKPCAVVPQGSHYEIELSVMSLFDKQLPRESGFVFRIEDGDISYRYYNCRVVGQKTETKENDVAFEKIFMEAECMEKQVSDHE